jgi:hypothetical protein
MIVHLADLTMLELRVTFWAPLLGGIGGGLYRSEVLTKETKFNSFRIIVTDF